METSQELRLLCCHAAAFQNEPSHDATATVASLAASLVCHLRYHVLILPISSPTVPPPPTVLRSPYCFHVHVPSTFRPHKSLLCISTPAHRNSVQWIRNSPLLMRFIYKTYFFSKAEINFLEMSVIQMSTEAIRSLEIEKMRTDFTAHVVESPKPP